MKKGSAIAILAADDDDNDLEAEERAKRYGSNLRVAREKREVRNAKYR